MYHFGTWSFFVYRIRIMSYNDTKYGFGHKLARFKCSQICHSIIYIRTNMIQDFTVSNIEYLIKRLNRALQEFFLMVDTKARSARHKAGIRK